MKAKGGRKETKSDREEGRKIEREKEGEREGGRGREGERERKKHQRRPVQQDVGRHEHGVGEQAGAY